MNFINKLSYAVKSKDKSYRGLATHLAIALSFALIAIGYIGYLANQTLAQTVYELSFDIATSDYIIDVNSNDTYWIDVRLSQVHTEPVTVDYVFNRTGTDTAVEGEGYDYYTLQAHFPTLTFQPGDIVKRIPVIILDTAIGNRFFTLGLDASSITPARVVIAPAPFDKHTGTLVMPNTDPIMSLQFIEPAIGNSYTIGDSIGISLTGTYNEYITEPFKLEFSVCFNNPPDVCLPEKLIPDAIYTPGSGGVGDTQFFINRLWVNAGYLLDGSPISQSLINGNVYIRANVFDELDPGKVYLTDIRSGNFSINETIVTVDINIVRPDASHPTWTIDSTESIQWVIMVGGVGGDSGISQYSLYYAVDGTNNWIPIEEHIALVGGSPPPYNWLIPKIDDSLLGSDFRIKISTFGNDQALIAEGISELFIINYDPVNSFIVEAPSQITTDLGFDVTITAIDQYNNIITNFNDPNIILDYTVDSNVTITNKIQGTLSVWNNGLATLSNNQVSFTLADGIDISTASVVANYTLDGTTLITGSTNVDFVRNLVIVEVPNDLTSWFVGDTENIIFKASGIIPIDNIKIYYSESGGLPDTWMPIDENVNYNLDQPQSYPWTIPPMISSDKNFRIKVETYDASDSLIEIGISELFIIGLAPELVGTYISKEFIVADANTSTILQSIDGFSAIADETANGVNSRLEFYIRFIEYSGGYLGSNPDGWIAVNYPSDNVGLSGLDISLVEKVQFKIYMNTVDISLYNPWVQSFTLDYTVQIPDPISDFNLFLVDDHRMVVQGETLLFDITINRDQNPSFLEGITFSSTILTDTTVWDKVVDQDPVNSFFGTPPSVTDPSGVITLEIKILDIIEATYTDQELSFTITGISTGAQQIERSVVGYITVVNAPAITINATVPLELGLIMPEDNDPNPEAFIHNEPDFTLRLYESTITDKTDIDYEVGNIIATDYDETTQTATLQIDIPEGNIINGITYSLYVRTFRHLWDKATTDITIDVNNPTYTVTFPKLYIGDVSLDNIINVMDFNMAIIEFGQNLLSYLTDFNFDDEVNVMDINSLFMNWFRSGILPTNNN